MLLRSTSSPISKSMCIHHHHKFLLQPNMRSKITVTPYSTASLCLDSDKKILRTCSDSSDRELIRPRQRLLAKGYALGLMEQMKADENNEYYACMKKESFVDPFVMSSAAWSDVSLMDEKAEAASVGGGGGGGNRGGGDGDGFWDSRHWSESMDEYYKKMIEAYPADALLLGNYAKFLREICGDELKAEEYCERAILAKPNDGNVLSLYGDLVWNIHKDGTRAQSYFDQAVQAAPDDCFVLASYAKFLWDTGEEEEECKHEKTKVCGAESTSNIRHGWPPKTPPPLPAAS